MALDDMALTSVVSRLLEQELKERAEKIGQAVADQASAELRRRILEQTQDIAFNVRAKLKVAATQAHDPRQIKVEIIFQLP